MTTTAFDDQFSPPPTDDLEAQCLEARNRVKVVCVWKAFAYDHEAQTECGSFIIYRDRYKFCPFCGKRIEVKS
jgi:hypothetical protein